MSNEQQHTPAERVAMEVFGVLYAVLSHPNTPVPTKAAIIQTMEQVMNKEDGPFQLNKTIPETVKQNLKNLVFTNKGERIMDPLFGIGVYSYLFENYTPDVSVFRSEEHTSELQSH